jgi:hypothetical protein
VLSLLLAHAFYLRAKKSSHKYLPLFSGLFFAATFWFRFQMAVPILVFAIWAYLYERNDLKRLLVYGLIGFGTGILVGVGVDSAGYGNWVFTPWNYLYQNLVLKKSELYGVSPFWGYLELVLKNFFPLGIMVFGLFLFDAVKNKRSFYVYLCVALILVHSFIAHKEFRFISMVFWFAPLFLAKIESKRIVKILKGVSVVFLFVYAFFPYQTNFVILRKVYSLTPKDKVIQVLPNSFFPADVSPVKINFINNQNHSFVNLAQYPNELLEENYYYKSRQYSLAPPFPGCELLLAEPGIWFRKILDNFPGLVEKTKMGGISYWRCRP